MKTAVNTMLLAALSLWAVPAASQDVPKSAQEELQHYMRAAGLSISWGEVGSLGTQSVYLSDVTIKADDWEIKTDRLIHSGREIDLMSVLITGGAGDGDITVDRIALSDIQALGGIVRLLDGDSRYRPSTEPIESCVAQGSSDERSIFLQNVNVTGDRDAMPEGLLEAERITFGLMEITEESLKEGPSCTLTETMRTSDMTVFAADGARIVIGAGVYQTGYIFDSATGMAGDDVVSRDRLQLKDIAISNADGAVSAQLGLLTSETVMDGAIMDVTLSQEASDIVDPLSRSNASQTLSLEGIAIDVEGFFPSYLIEVLSLEDKDFISGDAHFAVAAAEGDVTVDMDMNLPGLGEMLGKAHIGLPASMDVTLPGFIADKLPVPSAILDVRIHALEVAYEDDGIGEVIRSTTGMLPAEHLEKNYALAKARLDDKLPEFVGTKLDAAAEVFSDLLRGGGRVLMKPAAPMTVMSIVMQGMMGADKLAEQAGLEVVLHSSE